VFNHAASVLFSSFLKRDENLLLAGSMYVYAFLFVFINPFIDVLLIAAVMKSERKVWSSWLNLRSGCNVSV
jgi:hypothetical protein